MKARVHNFSGRLGGRRTPLAWPICVKCGLVLLRNRATDKAASRPCPGTPDDQLENRT